jgi:hypothetical protein
VVGLCSPRRQALGARRAGGLAQAEWIAFTDLTDDGPRVDEPLDVHERMDARAGPRKTYRDPLFLPVGPTTFTFDGLAPRRSSSSRVSRPCSSEPAACRLLGVAASPAR